MKHEHSNLFDSDGSDILEVRSGGGCVSLIGLPIAFVGLLMLTIASGLSGLHSTGQSAPSWVLGLIGLPFLIVGYCIVAFRSRLAIDRRTKTVSTGWTVLPYGRRKEQSIERASHILLDKYTTGGKSQQTYYRLSLIGPDQKQPIEVNSTPDRLKARQGAETLAKFLNLPIEDTSEGVTIRREVAELDRSVRDLWHARQAEEPAPPAPAQMKSRCEQTSDGLRIEIPPRVIAGRWVVAAVALVLMFSASDLVLLPLQRGVQLPLPVLIISALFSLVFVGAILFALARLIPGRTIVLADRSRLRVEQQYLLYRRAVELTVEEIEELFVVDRSGAFANTPPTSASQTPAPQTEAERRLAQAFSTGRTAQGQPLPGCVTALVNMARSGGIVARGDRGEARFGEGLPPDELAYLLHLVRTAIV